MLFCSELHAFLFFSVAFNFTHIESAHDDKGMLIDVSFKIAKASNEFLVVFKNYYFNTTREKYIVAALRKYNVHM